MHTLKIIGAGLTLLGVFLLAGRAFHQAPRLALYFLPVWLAATFMNLWYGITRAGYSFRDEAPIFLLVFAVPAAVAILAWQKLPA